MAHDSVSKLHCLIDFNINQNKYYIIDKNSTNGTELLLNEDKCIVLDGKMNFTLGEKNFFCEIINKSNNYGIKIN